MKNKANKSITAHSADGNEPNGAHQGRGEGRREPREVKAQAVKARAQVNEKTVKASERGRAVKRGVAGVGMGGTRRDADGGRPPARGPLAQRARIVVGSSVANASGRGVWGYGVVEAVIPAGVSPWHYCFRRGLVQMFRRDTPPMARERYIVFGDDGAHHAPARVVWQAS